MAPHLLLDSGLESHGLESGRTQHRQDPEDESVIAANSTGLLHGPLVWNTARFGSPETYTLQLTTQDKEELDQGLASFKGLGLDGAAISQDNFPLPNLGERLRIGAANIHHGQGLFVVHGLDPHKYSVADNAMMYLGISSYIGDKRGMQNKKGEMLSHVTDSKLWTVPREKRHGIHTSAGLPFHNDMGTDILALHVRQCANKGGSTFLASAWAIYNELVSSDSKCLETMFAPIWPIQVSGRNSRYVLAPLMQFHNGKLMVSVDPGRLGPQLTIRPRPNDVPPLTDEQRAVLSTFLKVASRHQVRVQLHNGDMLFVNNWAILHRRESYKDDNATSRHLVRLWLRNSKLGWEVPQALSLPWLAAYGSTACAKEVYPLEPMPEYRVPRYSAGSAAFVIDSDDESHDD